MNDQTNPSSNGSPSLPATKSEVRVLFIGDIVGTAALAMVVRMLPSLKAKYASDFIIANGENIADGKSLTKKHAADLFGAGVQVITSGNHVWDRWDAREMLSNDRRILRPANYPRENAGSGLHIGETADGIKIGVLNLQGRTYMQTIDCPFRVSNWALDKIAEFAQIVIVDMHAEATAEKQTMARYLDGKVSAVLGTHTHVQTADAQILPNGTSYISDVGMTGPYESVIGMKIDIAVRRFLNQTPYKYDIAKDGIRIAGVSLTIDVATGATLEIEPFMFPDFERTRMPLIDVDAIDESDMALEQPEEGIPATEEPEVSNG
ncbi:MAG: TIGR00282 family metallophosphoesterase [Bacteroidota bacterium]|nr:TIGR00282 family metallophosphoesterase [Bacteroidota bacterium]MDP4233757.1 TIGR00282 family metallophosphoesterase [Bacteroidota bacterium]MDP4242396.1 TIGR00282 family metallophosphoesterase [Bacteroidota bacterium]MDP4287518.1 TIGR00282 family metallophosphoesterase [Bacteroidota bacterium]